MLGPGERWPWEQWAAAWRGLPENPLAQYFRLTEQRRLSRVAPWRRRATLLLLTAFVSAGLQSLILRSSQGQVDLRGLVATLPFGLPVALYFVWLFQGLFEAMSAALHVLGPPGRQRLQLHMDDLLALTTMRDEEIVLGALSVILPPLWIRAAIGAALLWGAAVLVATQFGTSPLSDEVLAVFTWAPVTIGGIALAGMLAATSLSLLWLTLGRGQRAELLAAGGMLTLILGQLAWLVFSISLVYQNGGGWDEGYSELQPMAAVVGVVMLLVIVFLQLAFAQSIRPWRSALTVSGPLVLPLALLIAVNANYSSSLFNGDPSTSIMLINFAWSWGMLVPLNPAALASLHSIGIDTANLFSYSPGAGFVTPWRFGLLLAAQGALVLLCASAARESVARRRRGA